MDNGKAFSVPNVIKNLFTHYFRYVALCILYSLWILLPLITRRYWYFLIGIRLVTPTFTSFWGTLSEQRNTQDITAVLQPKGGR